MSDKLHVIAFDIPYPPDYGGVMDVYYRVKGLHEAGVYVILHCFAYGREENREALLAIADEVYYYPRVLRQSSLFSHLPFIIKTRIDESLALRLLEDEHPILMEGHHSTALLSDPRFEHRACFVRIHNNEQRYYQTLSKKEKNLFRKWFYRLEAGKLGRYESRLSKARALFCISPAEQTYFKRVNHECFLWEAGVPSEAPVDSGNMVMQVLFQGNLSVHENEEIAFWLLGIWKRHKPGMPLVIAGKNPSVALRKSCARQSQVQLIPNPAQSEMQRLVQQSAWCVAASRQNTGIKLKLIYDLMYGNQCLVNDVILEGSGLEQEVQVFRDENELMQRLQEPIDPQQIAQRRAKIRERFDAGKSAAIVWKAMQARL